MAFESVSRSDDFAARLSLALRAANLSGSQLSASVGVDKSVVSRWLSGHVQPTSYNLARISAAIAKVHPGFNMTLWTAPRQQFEAAIGLDTSVNIAPPKAVEMVESAGRGVRSMPHISIWTAGAAIALFLLIGIGIWAASRAISPPAPAVRLAAKVSPASIAVLPFVNMSGDPAKEYLGDGISEEILNNLANASDLRVAARTSSFAFKGTHADIPQIAKKLNVRTVLEGSVRQDGDRVRIVAQLIDAQSGFHIWSARYDRKLDDILAVQDQIAGAIVTALSQKLVRRRPTPYIAPEAYQDYLQAQYFFRQRTVTGFRRADELTKKALRRQPDFAAAYALRAHLVMLSAGDDRALLAEAQRMAAKALQLEPGNQDALDTKLELSLRAWDWAAVYRTGRQLLSQPRRSANTYNGIGFFYQYMGFPRLALEARRQAAERDPLAFSYRNNLASAQWHVGQRTQALATAARALELQPNHLAMLYELCGFNAALGRMEQARYYAQLIAAVRSSRFPWVGRACAIEIALGERRNAQALALLDRMDRKEFDAAELALLYARAGDLNQAMTSFSQAYDSRDQWLIWIRYDAGTPKAALEDPRWKTIWQRPSLMEWQRYHDRIAAGLARGTLR